MKWKQHPDLIKGYLAGLFDGEGCVGLYRRYSKDRHYRLVIKISMIDQGPVKLAHDIYGGFLSRGKPRSDKHRSILSWIMFGKPCRKFIEDIIPFSLNESKRDQLKLALNYLIKVNPKHGSFKGSPYTEEQIQYMEWVANGIKALKGRLNKAGRPSKHGDLERVDKFT